MPAMLPTTTAAGLGPLAGVGGGVVGGGVGGVVGGGVGMMQLAMQVDFVAKAPPALGAHV